LTGSPGQASPIAAAPPPTWTVRSSVPHEHDLERSLDRAEGLEQVVRILDGLATGRHDQVAAIDAGRLGEAALLDATDQDPGTLRQTDRAAHPPGDVGGRDGDAEACGLGRLAATQGLDPLAQGGIRRKGEVEALADPVRVDPDTSPRRRERPPTIRSERRGVFDAASIRRPPGPRNARTSPTPDRT
jgi:hypothetical protein